MSKADYAAQRLDPRWQRMRLEIMERDNFKCVDCGSAEKTLNVHHAYYVTGRKCWNYPRFSLSTLCWECHEERHATPDPEDPEHEEGLDEWEHEMNWLLAGNPANAGAFWYVAADFHIFLRDSGMGAQEFYKAVRLVLANPKAEGAL